MTPPILNPGRRTRGPYAHLVPLNQVKPAILAHLESAPRKLHELAILVGYSEHTVREHLLDLESEQRAHRVRGAHAGAGGKIWLWHAGPAPEIEELEEIIPGETTRQHVVRTYPIIGRRDNLVAALFGPAGASA